MVEIIPNNSVIIKGESPNKHNVYLLLQACHQPLTQMFASLSVHHYQSVGLSRTEPCPFDSVAPVPRSSVFGPQSDEACKKKNLFIEVN